MVDLLLLWCCSWEAVLLKNTNWSSPPSSVVSDGWHVRLAFIPSGFWLYTGWLVLLDDVDSVLSLLCSLQTEFLPLSCQAAKWLWFPSLPCPLGSVTGTVTGLLHYHNPHLYILSPAPCCIVCFVVFMLHVKKGMYVWNAHTWSSKANSYVLYTMVNKGIWI